MSKNKILSVLLCLAMVMTTITASVSTRTANAAENMFSITYRNCSYFSVQDRYGNVLFEQMNGNITQQDESRVSYRRRCDLEYMDSGNPSGFWEDLYVAADGYFIINCIDGIIMFSVDRIWNTVFAKGAMQIINNDENELIVSASEYTQDVGIHIGSPVSLFTTLAIDSNPNVFSFKDNIFSYSLGIPQSLCLSVSIKDRTYGRVYTDFSAAGSYNVMNDAVLEEYNHLLEWNKVPKAQRYVIYKTDDAGKFKKFKTTKKTSYTATASMKARFKVKAQKKVKGRWKTIKTINLTPNL